MPNHVHVLIKPVESDYSIAAVTKSIKGRFAKGYLKYLMESGNTRLLRKCSVIEKGCPKHRFWQRGGGFDRNIWNPKAVYDAVSYIEANPVRAKLVSSPEEWRWSSARARKNQKGIVPDTFCLPVKLTDPQK
jgi:putative transposase